MAVTLAGTGDGKTDVMVQPGSVYPARRKCRMKTVGRSPLRPAVFAAESVEGAHGKHWRIPPDSTEAMGWPLRRADLMRQLT